MNSKTKILILVISSAISYAFGSYMGKKVIKEVQLVEVEKVVVQENVRTVIKERPDGTKTTIVESVKTTDTAKSSVAKSKITPPEKTWSIWASAGSSLNALERPTYTIGVDRKWILGAFLGLYGRTDGEFGLTLRYEF